ncbi:threonine synthase [Arachnia propionica]|uniref:Threonine synthase n=1 Tax=Arachnia propionica TaxID=1750 RepID=A0A3P1T532_9ACTN|nr:threonine synthase [Arachnia propionica]RRD04581.1 threonine synthase [Arachnia propionica]
MRYVSTRSTTGESRSFSDILLEGLAPDGGLYLPDAYPVVDDATLGRWRRVLAEDGYAALAFEVCSLFVDDIPAADLRGICERAYAPEKYLDPAVVPVSRLSDGIWLAHLSNGPTAAFKDMAMQLLGELFPYELARRGETLTILGATSGDTGSSAEHALKGRDGVRVVMLSPAGRMTPFQQAQMYGLDEDNIVNLAVEGVFDDCQDLVKAINADAEFKARHRIGAVNSINWARLMAQIVYYFATWLRIVDGEPLSFAVPSGNFGNIAAGHIARRMGLPIRHLVLATNENDVLDEFFRTGIYRVRSGAETLATSSPSMDISKASNFERFVADLLGRDGTAVAELFGTRLATDGWFDLSGVDRTASGFVSGSSRHADRVAEIRATWEQDRVLIDPHTADGVHVARRLVADGQVTGPVVVMETALPVKFAETITEAVGITPPRPERFIGIEDLPRHVQQIPARVEAVKAVIEGR